MFRLLRSDRPHRRPVLARLVPVLGAAVIVVASCSPAPTATPSESSIDFGAVATGTTQTRTVDVTVHDFLPAARNILQVRVLPDSDVFAVESFECPAAEDIVTPGQLTGILTCHLTVSFHPPKDGSYTGEAHVFMLFFPTATITLSGSTTPSPVLAEAGQAIILPFVGLLCVGAWLVVNRRRARSLNTEHPAPARGS